jgi:hypothetical protein
MTRPAPRDRSHPAMVVTYLIILLWAAWSWIRPDGP